MNFIRRFPLIPLGVILEKESPRKAVLDLSWLGSRKSVFSTAKFSFYYRIIMIRI